MITPENENLIKAIEVTSKILDKKYKASSFKSIFINAFKSLCPSIWHTIIISLITLLTVAYPLLKLLKVSWYTSLPGLVIILSLFYIVLFIRDLIKISREMKNNSYSERLISAIKRIKRTSLEKAYEPFVEPYEINQILEELMEFDLDILKRLELELTYQNNLSKKNYDYFNKFFPLMTTLLILLIYGSGTFQTVFAGFLGLYIYYLQLSLGKYSVDSKAELCIHLIKQVQLLKGK